MRTRLHLRIGKGSVRAEALRHGRAVWGAVAAFEDEKDLGEVIAHLAGEAGVGTKPLLRVTLEPPLVQMRTLRNIPPVRRPALRMLVASQSRRYFRVNGSPLVTDACWASGSWIRPGGDVVAAAVEEPWLDAIAAGADAAGLRLETIEPESNPGHPRLELLSSSLRARHRLRSVTARRRLGWTTAGLWVLALTLVGVRLVREGNRIDRDLARLRAPAAALLGLHQQLDRATLMVKTIERSKAEQSLILHRIAAMVAALPDSAYLNSLSLDLQGRGTATGGAPQATRVVAAWDRDGTVINPRLAGPAVRENIAGRERERFTITFGPPLR